MITIMTIISLFLNYIANEDYKYSKIIEESK